ncbi:protoporphyrinogen/coproporphyrinogen oxidase [Hydrocarboniphaga sp.]|uniref:protoporphyrinogen/coproporphyrinogen oxidase n=1 Tax=Hydrocarboniphaga sp. TaxID=2033016 RepID=UPI003D13D0A4
MNIEQTQRSARVAVVGAGVGGAMAAYRLKAAGCMPVVFEAGEEAGGRTRTLRQGGFIFDTGAVGLLGSYTKTRDVAREIGMADQFLTLRPMGAIPRDGVLRYLDMKHPIRSFLFSDLFSLRAKLRLARVVRDVARLGQHLNYEQVDALVPYDVETVEQYSRRALNDELYDYLADTLTRGAWLAPGEQASVIQFFWTAKNFTPHMYSLKGGMNSLSLRLLDGIEVKFNSPVLSVDERPGGVELTYQTADGERSERFESCVIAVPPKQALPIFPQMISDQREYFKATQYSRSVNVHFGLSRRPTIPALYIMVPKRECTDVTTIFLDHLKSPDRAPPGKGMVSVFLRAEWCDQRYDTPDKNVIDEVLGKLKPYLGDLGSSAEEIVVQRWANCALLVKPGIFAAMSRHYRSINPTARVQLAGDYAPFSSVNTAVVSGENAAKLLIARMRTEGNIQPALAA